MIRRIFTRVALALWILAVSLVPSDVNYELPIDWPQTQTAQKLYAKTSSPAALAILNMRMYESEEGKPRWLVKSQKAEIQRDDNYAFLTQVDSDFYSRKTGNIIRATSDYGRCSFGKQRVDLEGNVHIHSQRGYEFTMDTVRYLGHGREMTSPDIVTMRGPDPKKPELFLRGLGLIADIDYEHFILKRNVYSRKRLKNSSWMYIQSQTADFFTQEQRGVYVGNCRATLPRMTIQSDVFEVMMGSTERLHARGHAILKSRKRIAHAESALIEIELNRIVLDGRAYVDNEGGNQVRGKRITLYTDEDRIEVEGAEGKVQE